MSINTIPTSQQYEYAFAYWQQIRGQNKVIRIRQQSYILLIINHRHMGSRITRALNQSDRQRRLPPASQQEARQFIKAICTSMISILFFSIGFMTSHSTQAHTSCFEYLCTALICSIVLNASSPQTLLIAGWIMVTLQSLFMSSYARVLFSMGSFMVIYSSFTNIFNYYSNLQPTHSFIRNLIPCVLMIIGECLLRVAHCSSHYIKLLRAETTKLKVEQDHHFGLRLLFCVMGLMVVMLLLMGHVYIRRKRFIPMSFQQQLRFAYSLKIVKITQAVLLLMGLRSVMLSVQQTRTCLTDAPLIVDLIATCSLVGLFAKCVSICMCKVGSVHGSLERKLIKCENILSLAVLVLYCICMYANLHIYIAYLASMCLCLLLVLHLSNIIPNEHRSNYTISIIVAIICQTNKMQHMHTVIEAKQYIITAAVCISAAFLVPWLMQVLRAKLGGYQEVRTQSSEIEHSDLIDGQQ